LSCPDDIAVVSYDGTTESEYCWPPLTVARQPIQAMAEAAVSAVLNLSSPPLPIIASSLTSSFASHADATGQPPRLEMISSAFRMKRDGHG
jgi:DNA-binding LacI/PurR family transcriptional regulator